MKIALTHSTTACVLLEIGSVRILTDPVFDEGERSYRLGPAAYATRHVGPAIDPGRLGRLDSILLSHAHHLDNLDDSGQEFVENVPHVVTGVRSSERAGSNAHRLSVWDSVTITGSDGFQVKVTATPAVHGPWWLSESHHVIGFVLEWAGQQRGAFYISGDTVYFRGLREIGRRFTVSAAMLHLGAVHFWPPWPPFLRYTFNGVESARLAGQLGVSTVIPVHYERSVWSHFRESRESYENSFADAGLSSRLTWLQPGKRTIVDV